MMTLFYSPGACSLASHIALEEAGAPYEAVRVNLRQGEQRKPEYLAVNSKGRVPALATDRGTLTENPAILAYVAQTFPEAALAPLDDPFAFAEMQAFNSFLASSVHVAFAHRFRPERYADGKVSAEAMRAKSTQSLSDFFALIEDRLGDGRPWVTGDAYTVADPYLMVFSGWLLRHLPEVAKEFPRVEDHRLKVEARDAVKRVLAVEAG